jgi:hypothetical protein
MTTPEFVDAYEPFLVYLAERASPEEILGYRASPAQQTRFEALMERSKAGEISLQEREELEHLVRVDRLVTLLKTKALRTLKDHDAHSE